MKLLELPRTTYRAGMLQAKAYRKLKEFMTSVLKKYDITMMEWALIGHIYDSGPQGVRSGGLASIFNTEPSLLTNMINKLEKRDLVERISDPDDKRAKRVIATKKGEALVQVAERDIVTQMKKWLSPIPRKQLYTYIRVIKKINEL